MIKALIFDNNGVLTKTEGEAVPKMAALFGVSYDHYYDVWKECAKPLDDGGITTEEFLRKVVDYFEPGASVEPVRELYHTCYERDDEMHSIVSTLSSNFEIALLSNFGDSFDIFDKKWRTSETIKPENIFVSVKLGMRKPKPEIYHYALGKLGLEPDEVIFIDDREENVKTAKEIGMAGIVFRDSEQFLNELQKLTSI